MGKVQKYVMYRLRSAYHKIQNEFISRYRIDVQKYFMYRQLSAYHKIQNEVISRCRMRFDTKVVNKIEKKTYCYVQKYFMSILQ